jgi:RHS repeat-associated protein
MKDSTVMGYDANGNLAWRQDGRGDVGRVSFAYYTDPAEPGYAPGLLKSISAPPPPPQIITRVECTGEEARSCFPVHDTIYPPAATEKVEYDALGNVRATITALGFRTDYRNDAMGRLSRAESPIDGLHVQTDSTEYDAMGRVIFREIRGPRLWGQTPQTPERLLVRNWYDREGNLRRVDRWADPDQAGVGTITTRFERDAAERVVAEFAPDGTPGDSTDNPVDRTVFDPAGNVIRVRTRRWASARQIVAADTLADIRMQYDALNRLTIRKVPAVRYSARHEGIPAARPELNTRGENPDYPRYPNDGQQGYVIAADSVRLGYDAVGNLIRADNSDAEIRRSYYTNGSVHTDTLRIRALRPLADGTDWSRHVYGIEYIYDLNGRVTSIGHPEQLAPKPGTVTRYGYDPGNGSMDRVTDPLGHVYRYTFDSQGQVDLLRLPQTFQEQYQHDDDGKLSLHSVTSTGGKWRQTSFTYDQRGKVLRTSNPVNVVDTLVAHYSGLGHLISDTLVSHRDADKDTKIRYLAEESYAPDALANLVRKDTRDSRYIGGALQSRSTLLYLNRFEKQTGRLIRADRAAQSDTLKYDLAGNVEFVEGRAKEGGSFEDRASFYGIDGTLRAADHRTAAGTAIAAPFRTAFEEFRYDALGRRIQTWARRTCLNVAEQFERSECNQSHVRRTVWEGNREFYEIQMPAGSATSPEMIANDTAEVRLALTSDYFDPNPLYGRVAYTYGYAVDRPLAITRIKHADAPLQKLWVGWSPFTIVPLWNSRGEADNWFYAETGGRHCRSDDANRCVTADFPAAFAAYHPEHRPSFPWAWHGTLTLEKRDATGTLYRRNRYYDPKTGRFTQEDPIGLAGGLNLYGFAAGDPITYSDPLGLRVCFTGPGTAANVAATERASGTTITLDAENCIQAIVDNPRSRGYRHLGEIRRRLRHMAFGTPRTYYVKSTTEGKATWADYGREPFTLRIGVNWESGPSAPYETTQLWTGGCLPPNAPGRLPALVTHELLGHAYWQDTHGHDPSPSGEPYARSIENVYHAAVGEPRRCTHPKLFGIF